MKYKHTLSIVLLGCITAYGNDASTELQASSLENQKESSSIKEPK